MYKIKKFKLKLIISIFIALALPVHAMSWCTDNNLNYTEHTICNNEYLMVLDDKLQQIYQQLRSKRIEVKHLAWRKKYLDRCAVDQQCIENEYNNRIETLLLHSRLQQQETPVSWCSALSLNETERSICLNRDLRILETTLEVIYGQARSQKQDFEQLYWLQKERDFCRSDVTCIKNSYRKRIKSLKLRIGSEHK